MGPTVAADGAAPTDRPTASAEGTPSETGADRVAHSIDATLERFRHLPWHIVGPVLVYLLLVVLGATMSSIGIEALREDPAHPHGFQLGHSVPIRSDEYLTGSPMVLGVLATGQTDDLNPLTAPDGFSQQMSSGVVSSIVFFDGTILRAGSWLPQPWLFAARWWLPTLLLVLAAPAFFRNITGNPRIGWWAACLIVASPVTVWWSFGPLAMIGWTLAGAVALQTAARRWGEGRRAASVAWAVASAVLLARTPLHYQPWAIVVAVPILLTALSAMLAPRQARRVAIVSIVGVGAAAVALLAGIVAENWASIQAVTGTVYPGARQATGGPVGLQQLFGATNLVHAAALPIVGTNLSEISSSYGVAVLWAVVLLTFGLRLRSTEHKVAVVVLAACTAFWFAWTLVDFGGLGYKLPLANLVPPFRAADVLGYLAVLLVCLLLPGLVDRPGWRPALVSALLVGLVAAHAGSLLRAQNFPTMSTRSIWLAAVAVAAVVAVVSARPRSWMGYGLALLLAATLVWRVNPILFGLGDLRASATAEQMLRDGRAARAAGQVWATDSAGTDALLVATGVPSASGRQIAGPDVAAWRRLAPSAQEAVWNRGGSFIVFRWTDDPDVTATNPAPDHILVTGSPCVVAQRIPDLDVVVASQTLTQPCLRQVRTFSWGGSEHWVYAVQR
ncbi:MAG: hypothetical protein B7X41_02765 [Microbacterium sp. 14-71-5]|nr:MAG: hypothetical protein B7X41_02765 [Microbacterium sp. 14-71-5]